MDNAAVIVSVGKAMRVPERGWVIAVATAMQESTLHNIDYGDIMGSGEMSSSRGLFQQLQTYGPDRMIPAIASKMFYTGGPSGLPGLLQVPGWESMPLAVAAETVQRSAQPELYAKWEQPALQVVGKVEGRACSAAGSAGGQSAAAAGAVARALTQVGVPYSWGGGDASGPTMGICTAGAAWDDCRVRGFDCSGLTVYAYAGEGISLPHQTQAIWAMFASHITDRAALLPGDLLLISSNGALSGIHHVAIWLGDDQVVEAPESGSPVRVKSGFWASDNGLHFLGAVRPAGDS